MKHNKCLTSIIFTVILSSTTASSYCIYEVCFCEEMIIDCSGLGLREIPQLSAETYGDATNLLFDNNQISEVLPGSLPSDLQQISFMKNPIVIIDNHAFDPSGDTLQSLSFSQALFIIIPNALAYINKLRNLEIYDTNIVDWNVDVMEHIGMSLQTLILSNVTLTTWPVWLSNFSSMTDLTLINCLLTSIPDDALNKMSNSLMSLTLTGNLLTTVPKALSNLTALERLYVDMNKITDTTWLPKSNKLFFLALNVNKIFNASQLSQSLRPFANSLTEFNIVTNKLTSIPELDFLRISSLDLSFNLIYDTRSGSLSPNLLGINLDHNLLTTIPSAVSGLKSIMDLGLVSNSFKQINGRDIPNSVTSLDISYNFITALTATSFTEYSSIKYLRVNNNPLTTISSTALSNLRKLLELYIRNTKITRLPLGLSSLTRINMLDLSGNEGLVCTCMEKSLENWIISLSSYKVVGNCGQLSIYDFFTLLGPKCPEY